MENKTQKLKEDIKNEVIYLEWTEVKINGK